MKKMNPKEILIPAVSLFIICLVVTALLGVTNKITSPMIAERAKANEVKARQTVLASAESFSEPKEIALGDKTYTYYDGMQGENLTGYVFTTSAKGYGDEVVVMVGIDQDGVITGMEFLNLAETAGLGMNAKKPDFMQQFVGKSGTINVVKSDPKETDIQALTGATITSKAVTSAVNTALDLYKEVKSNG